MFAENVKNTDHQPFGCPCSKFTVTTLCCVCCVKTSLLSLLLLSLIQRTNLSAPSPHQRWRTWERKDRLPIQDPQALLHRFQAPCLPSSPIMQAQLRIFTHYHYHHIKYESRRVFIFLFNRRLCFFKPKSLIGKRKIKKICKFDSYYCRLNLNLQDF